MVADRNISLVLTHWFNQKLFNKGEIIMVRYCEHAFERGMLRMSIRSEEEFNNYVQRAWYKGKTVSDFSGKAYKYLLEKEQKQSKNTVIRIFAGYCFIFKTCGILVTVFPIAPWVLKNGHLKRTRFRGEENFISSDCEGLFLYKVIKRTMYVLFLFVNM